MFGQGLVFRAFYYVNVFSGRQLFLKQSLGNNDPSPAIHMLLRRRNEQPRRRHHYQPIWLLLLKLLPEFI